MVLLMMKIPENDFDRAEESVSRRIQLQAACIGGRDGTQFHHEGQCDRGDVIDKLIRGVLQDLYVMSAWPTVTMSG
jgi:hypothetical protein